MKLALSELLNSVDNEEEIADARGPLKLQHVLSLDDRANLYLNALYGKREFTTDEYNDARETIIDAMAAEIRAEPGNNDDAEISGSDPTERDLHYGASNLGLQTFGSLHDRLAKRLTRSRDFDTHGPNPAPMMSDDAPADKNSEISIERRALAAISSALRLEPESAGPERRPMGPVSPIEASHLQSRSSAPSFLAAASVRRTNNIGSYRNPIGQANKRRVSIRSITIAATLSLMVLGPVALFILMGSELQDSKWTMVGQFSPDRWSSRPFHLDQRPAIDKSVPVDRLVGLGERLIAGGDVSAARLILTEAVKEGSAPAALTLGKTFDPNELHRATDASDLVNVESAKTWYEKAKQLGSSEAQAQLDRLTSRKP